MNTFLKNYWSLYMDFLHDFKTLQYSGFSLPYFFCSFHSVIKNNDDLWSKLYDETFAQQIRNQVKHQKEIQKTFNAFTQVHTRKSYNKNKYGKVIIHVDKLLRFPIKTFIDYFDPSQTTILNAGRSNSNAHQPTNRASSNKARIKTSALTIHGKRFKQRRNVITKGVNNIPIDYLQHYSINTKKAIKHVQNQARTIINSFPDHPLYKDKQFQEMFLMRIQDIIERIEQSKKFLDNESVSCIIVSTTHSFISRILALVAAERGIPTICMQHGIISGEFGFIPKIATVDAVYGDFEVDWYENIGAAKDSLEIIGHPRFDQAFTNRKTTRFTFNNKKQTLLLVMRDNQDIDKWRILISAISRKLDLNIVIKNHPNNYSQLLAREFPQVYFPKDYQLYDIIHNVDCVISYSSTVGLEAMLADKTTFILNEEFVGYSGYYDGLEEMVQADPHKLVELIIKYFNDPDWSSYTKQKREAFLKYAYPDSRSSGKRLKNLINKLNNQTLPMDDNDFI